MLRGFCFFAATLAALFAPSALAVFHDEGEAGLVFTDGNSNSKSISAANHSDVKNGKDRYQLGGRYNEAKQNGVLNTEKWLATLRYERTMTDVLTGILAQQVEGDIFAGILQRYNTDIAVKHFFLERPTRYFVRHPHDIMWFGEAGYRFTREHNTKDETNSFHKMRLYSEVRLHWNEWVTSYLWVEYVPNFTLGQNWLLNGELGLSTALSSVFGVKTFYRLNYSNAPPVGATSRTDTTLNMALTVKI